MFVQHVFFEVVDQTFIRVIGFLHEVRVIVQDAFQLFTGFQTSIFLLGAELFDRGSRQLCDRRVLLA